MTDWNRFSDLNELEQAHFLIQTAKAAWGLDLKINAEIILSVQQHLETAEKIQNGDFDRISDLMPFLEDPDMEKDFSAYYEIVHHNDRAAAALDLASYACGFVLRIAGRKKGLMSMPDPVIESLPEIYEYYQERARFLGI